MNAQKFVWNAADPQSWASALGLRILPLFPASDVTLQNAALLDGKAGSFTISFTDDFERATGTETTSWAWSSGLNASVTVDQSRDLLFLKRWGSDQVIRKFRTPRSVIGAAELFRTIEQMPDPKAEDVVLYVLRSFRLIRNQLRRDDETASLAILNALLLGAHQVVQDETPAVDWTRPKLLKDVMSLLSPANRNLLSASNQSLDRVQSVSISSGLLSHFIESEATTNCRLYPELLIRYASPQLYQESHLEIERANRQMYLPGMEADDAHHGILSRDVRYTPVALARMLTEKAFSSAFPDGVLPDTIYAFDPACGSGVFLLETLRELQRRNFTGKLYLRGADRSQISCELASFAVRFAVNDCPQMEVAVQIDNDNSLTSDWGCPDVILMNPPFIPWDRMDGQTKEQVASILSDANHFRPDIAMAFVEKCSQVLRLGGAVASVMPAPLFETHSGFSWRERLQRDLQLTFLGRFQGYGYFISSMVEPGFIVMRKPRLRDDVAVSPVVVVAAPGYEDRAMRAARRHTPQGEKNENFDVFEVAAAEISPSNWMPRPRQQMTLRSTLQQLGHPSLKDLFRVHQGALTGLNKAFVLRRNQWQGLPSTERVYFRPAAIADTIRDGCLLDEWYVFYPYDKDGIQFENDEAARRTLPEYFDQYLLPYAEKLKERSKVKPELWWTLSWPRSWQFAKRRKLITKYFGDRGSFALDIPGTFVALQGYGWFWEGTRSFDGLKFWQSDLPFAYLALLNTKQFEQVLMTACPRVQGGQFNLSVRFIQNLPIPDLSDSSRVVSEVVDQLAAIGREIHSGRFSNTEEAEMLAARAYAKNG